MSTIPTVSVVVPTHNRVRLLPLTLSSVLWQKDVSLEVIVVDDGSSDDVRSVVRGLNDPRVRLFRHDTPRGVSAARNLGVAKASGSWIAFLDDDDLWAPSKTVRQLRAAEQAGRQWAYAGAVNVTVDLRLLGGAPPASPDEVVALLPRANLIPGGCSGVIVHRDLLPVDPFDPAYRHFADWDLWIRLSRLGHPADVVDPLVGYRIHDSNRSLDTAGMVAELDVIQERYGGPVDRARFYRHVARVSLRASRRRAALQYYARAAVADRQYLRGDFLPDVTEIAQGLVRSLRRRFARAATDEPTADPPLQIRRYAAERAWVERAQPWLAELAARRKRRLESDVPDAVRGT